MRESSTPERVITFPLHEFIAMVETYSIPGQPLYDYVFKHYKQQILDRFRLEDFIQDEQA